jgi:flagellar hook-basal body complex protein FliE
MSPVQAPGIPLLAPHSKIEMGTEIQPPVEADGAGAFSELLTKAVGKTNETLHVAERVGDQFASGVRDDIHGTMLALSKADIELRTVANIKNKIVDAFYELWRMQI